MSQLFPVVDTTPPRAAHHIGANRYRSNRRPGGPISTVFWIGFFTIGIGAAVVLAWQQFN